MSVTFFNFGRIISDLKIKRQCQKKKKKKRNQVS